MEFDTMLKFFKLFYKIICWFKKNAYLCNPFALRRKEKFFGRFLVCSSEANFEGVSNLPVVTVREEKLSEGRAENSRRESSLKY